MTDTTYNRHLIASVVDQLKLDETTAVALRDAHEVDVRQGLDGAVTYTDGSADFGAWMRKVSSDRPALVGKGKPAPETTPTAPVYMANMSEMMLAVRQGRLSSEAMDAAMRDHFVGREQATAQPASPTMTMTQAMIAARQGDPHALEVMMKRYL